MSDIFISYKREDRPRARQIARGLEQQGFSVWWDRNIPPGKSFDRVIQEALDQATCVVVLWSEASVESDWVKEEAEKGASRGVLVPILIDAISIPLGFGRIQTANLVGWQGETTNPEFVQLTASIRRIIEGCDATFQIVKEGLIDPAWESDAEVPPPRRRPTKTRRAPRRKGSRSRTVLWATVTVVLSVSTGATGFYYARLAAQQTEPDPSATGPTASQPTPVAVAASVQPIPADPLPAAATGPEAGEASPADAAAEPPIAVEPPPQELPSQEPPPEETVDPAVEAYRQLSELQERSQDADADVAELLREYEELWSRHRQSLDADAAVRVMQTIQLLKDSIEESKVLQTLDQRNDLTIGEKLAHLRQLAADNPDGKLATAKIAELERIVESSATITAEDKFVTCTGVDRREGTPEGPVGVTDEFRPGQVHLFAWVNSPRARETLTLEWIDSDGSVAQTQEVTVSRNTATGYRVFYNKRHAEAGRYEVRLYNEAGELIGRRVFEVG